MIRRPPRSTLFPYPPLFRSLLLLVRDVLPLARLADAVALDRAREDDGRLSLRADRGVVGRVHFRRVVSAKDRKSTRLNSSHLVISYAVFCLKKKKLSGVAHSPERVSNHRMLNGDHIGAILHPDHRCHLSRGR